MDYNPSTGFSFGGLLACAVAASVWDTPYIGGDLLKEKLTCITFGQPHVSVEVTARLAMMRPEMAATLHAIYTQDDVVPRLMGLLDESWEARAKLEESSSQVGGAPPQMTGALALVSYNNTILKMYKLQQCLFQPFRDNTTAALLKGLGKLQSFTSVSKVHITHGASNL